MRDIDPPSLPFEDPVMLLILSKEGLALYSHRFEGGEQLDEPLIAGMIVALSNLGKDIFANSGAIEQITYQNYTIAMKPLESLRVCYIYQGPSHLALQKLDHFSERIRSIPDLKPLLTDDHIASKYRVPLDTGFETGLHQLITQIFIPKAGTPELTQIEQFLIAGQYQAAMRAMEMIERQADLSLDKRLRSQLLKSRILSHLGEYKEAQKLAEAVFHKSQQRNMQQYIMDALQIIAESLLLEFKFTEDPTILPALQTVTTRLFDLADAQQNPSVLAETYLLQAKLALIILDVPRARQLLTQAQIVAEANDLPSIAMRISHEHDALLGRLHQWENLTAHELSIMEVSEQLGIEEQLTRVIHKWAPEPPPLHLEDPILLLMLTEGGLILFDHSFKEEQLLDKQLIGGFIKVLTAVAQQIIASAMPLDRLMIQDYTLAMKPLETLLVCYVFQGQSYLALQKLDYFITRIRETNDLIQPLSTIIRRDHDSKALPALNTQIKSVLRQLITEIFSTTQPPSESGGINDRI